MVRKNVPENPGVIQALLTHLRDRKAALNDLIFCLERYSIYKFPQPRRSPGKQRAETAPRRVA
jgi:hypothetical protein